MKRTQPDPMGAGFWSLNEAQCDFGAALSEDYRRLRNILTQMRADSAKKIGSNLNWLKLCIGDIAEIDLSRRDDVYVRRGKAWQKFWDRHGIMITERQLTEPLDIRNLFDDP